MAYLIKDKLTNDFVGSGVFTDEEKARIEANGDYECVRFYDKKTCDAVIDHLEGGV